jgi:hypothetical protein
LKPDDAERLLEQVARNSVAIEKLSRVLGGIVEPKDRKLFTPQLKELTSSNLDLQDQIGKKCPELHPYFLGLESFSKLRKKYEDPENPITLPTKENIEGAKAFWLKIKKAPKK